MVQMNNRNKPGMSYNITQIGDLYQALAIDLSNRGAGPELPLYTLPALNLKMGGIRKRKLTVIGGRTSQGKSSFAMQVCYDLAQQCKNVLFLSLEMENQEAAERLLSHDCKIHNRSLMFGHDPENYRHAIRLGERLKTIPFYISDCIGKTWSEIDKLLNDITANMQSTPDVIVLDYIQNTKGLGTQKDIIDEYIRHFRELAIRHNFAGVLCSQINRTNPEAKDKTPQLHQLKGTGFLEEHADVVLLLHWPYFYDRAKDAKHFELYLAKNKAGETGLINLVYHPEYYEFEELKTKEEDWHA